MNEAKRDLATELDLNVELERLLIVEFTCLIAFSFFATIENRKTRHVDLIELQISPTRTVLRSLGTPNFHFGRLVMVFLGFFLPAVDKRRTNTHKPSEEQPRTFNSGTRSAAASQNATQRDD